MPGEIHALAPSHNLKSLKIPVCANTINREQIQQRVLRQFLEALIYEGILDCIKVDNHFYRDNTFYFNVEDRSYFCKGRLRAFDRPSLDIRSLAFLHNSQKQLVQPAHYSDLVTALITEYCPDNSLSARLQNELDQSLQWSVWNQQNLPPKHSVLAQNLKLAMPFYELECSLDEGHPYHPCFKARSGFTQEDHQRYSSESGQHFQLHWLAVHCKWLKSRLPMDKQPFYCHELGADSFDILLSRLQPHSVENYFFIPVHPWQWENHLQSRYHDLLEHKILIELGKLGDFYSASQSQRTLLNTSRPQAANIKLPLNILCTSSVRCLQKHSVISAPALSAWLAKLVESDPFYKKYSLRLLEEYAGLVFDDSTEHSQESQLACLWRESIETKLNPGEQALPFTALYAKENAAAGEVKAAISRWIEHYGIDTWLTQLLTVFVLPLWHLLVKHGIALEAHAQNSILIVRDGWPVALAMRDFHESLEYVEDFLAEPELCPDFKNQQGCYRRARINEYYWMDSVEALRELFMDTVFVYHLSELALCCERHFDFPESRFWEKIADQLDSYAASHPQLHGRIEQIGHRRGKISVESLLRRKMDSSANEFRHHVSNPFKRQSI